jgi:hypothetical protein
MLWDNNVDFLECQVPQPQGVNKRNMECAYAQNITCIAVDAWNCLEWFKQHNSTLYPILLKQPYEWAQCGTCVVAISYIGTDGVSTVSG